MARASRRPVRGAAVILCVAGALLSLPAFVPFAQPATSRLGLRSATTPSGLPQATPFTPPFAGRQRTAEAVAGPRASDAVSVGLAYTGLAVAMRATAAAASAGKEEEPKSLLQSLKVYIYVLLWYAFNVGYNIYNKQSSFIYPYPWACALWQMAFGNLIIFPLWWLGIRKMPKVSMSNLVTLSPAALGHLATHVGGVVSMFAGAVSFSHIVKASEPVVSSMLNFAFAGEVLPWQVYATLLPIIGGVGIASAAELSFTWLAFGAAMGSNIGSACRGVYSKKMMSSGKPIGENMDTANVFAVLTIMATCLLLPIACAIEGPTAMIGGFKAAYAQGGVPFLWTMFYAGLYYYLYNEVAFLALGQLDAVSHAVCNTMKRVVIIVASVFVFRTKITPIGITGSSIAIFGALLYSLAMDKYKPKK